MVVRQTSTQSLEVTVPNTGESFWIYMTVVFKDKSGAIIDGPLFSKCEVKHLSEYDKCCLFLPNKLCEVMVWIVFVFRVNLRAALYVSVFA